jgi:hypothetical protein
MATDMEPEDGCLWIHVTEGRSRPSSRAMDARERACDAARQVRMRRDKPWPVHLTNGGPGR